MKNLKEGEILNSYKEAWNRGMHCLSQVSGLEYQPGNRTDVRKKAQTGTYATTNFLKKKLKSPMSLSQRDHGVFRHVQSNNPRTEPARCAGENDAIANFFFTLNNIVPPMKFLCMACWERSSGVTSPSLRRRGRRSLRGCERGNTFRGSAGRPQSHGAPAMPAV